MRVDRLKLHLVSTSLKDESMSRALLTKLDNHLKSLGAGVSMSDVRDLVPRVGCISGNIVDYPAIYQRVFNDLVEAEGIIIATPIHHQGPSGEAHTFLDVFGKAFSSKPVAVVSASGSPRAHLAGEQLRGKLDACRAFAFNQTLQVGRWHQDGLEQRIFEFCLEFMNFARALRYLDSDERKAS